MALRIGLSLSGVSRNGIPLVARGSRFGDRCGSKDWNRRNIDNLVHCLRVEVLRRKSEDDGDLLPLNLLSRGSISISAQHVLDVGSRVKCVVRFRGKCVCVVGFHPTRVGFVEHATCRAQHLLLRLLRVQLQVFSAIILIVSSSRSQA